LRVLFVGAVAKAHLAARFRNDHMWRMSAKNHSVSALRSGLAGRCPRCGEGELFKGPATLGLRDRCSRCGLDYGFIDSGDGPAVFVIMLLGFIVLGAALIVEFKAAPPLWVHLVVWPPLTLLLAFALLRPMKATLIALQYKHKAEEARLANDGR
jgi:uncharacterized protein (DUF983 family)